MITDKEILEKISLDVKEIAKLVETTPATVYRWKNGELKMNALARKVLLSHIQGDSLPIKPPIDLKSFRKAARIGQNEVAILIGTSQSWVSQVENGQNDLTREQEEKILKKWPEADRFRHQPQQPTGSSTGSSEVENLLRKQIQLQEELLSEKDEKIQLLKEKLEFQRKGSPGSNGSHKAS